MNAGKASKFKRYLIYFISTPSSSLLVIYNSLRNFVMAFFSTEKV